MSSIITPQEMTDFLLKTLEDVVKDYPEAERESAKERILDLFSAAMFNGPMEKNDG
jgi:hypothetical protein